MATSSRVISENRPYQGYPFVNPAVIDVPTVDAATAAKWANLPRKPIVTPVHKTAKSASPSVHIDISSKAESSGAAHTGDASNASGAWSAQTEDAPVVYIDLPDETASDQTTLADREDRGQVTPGFVQETIFFDPFENRQIDVNRPKEAAAADSGRPGSAASRPAPAVPETSRPTRPAPPPNIDLQTPGSSGGASASSGVPGFMSKESQVYGAGSSEDGFSLSPLPVGEYPEPPPAYSELAPPAAGAAPPPRTVVVGPAPPAAVGLASSSRKLVECPKCRLRVHTVVVRENGVFTHFIAFITILLCILPVTVAVYCTDFFKYRVHFCPNCNHSVGYEIPVLCQSMVYHGP